MMIRATFLEKLLDPIFSPLLNLGAFWAIFIISLILTLIITLIYKLVTNQKLLKSLKEELKEMQKELKKLKDNPKKMMKKQKEMMSKNMEYMKHSMRSTLVTIIPVIVVFGWLNAHLAYQPLVANEPFNLTVDFSEVPSTQPEIKLPEGITLLEGYPKKSESTVLYSLNASPGNYQAPAIVIEYKNESCEIPVYVASSGSEHEYYPRVVNCNTEHIKKAEVYLKPLRPLGNLSIFGWHPGWFGTYIILSLILSMIIRKLLKVY